MTAKLEKVTSPYSYKIYFRFEEDKGYYITFYKEELYGCCRFSKIVEHKVLNLIYRKI